jgi:hypothetical protein
MTEAAAASTATDQMMDAYVKGDSAGAQALSAQVNREAGIEQPRQDDPLALAPMPPAPQAPAGEVDKAKATLTELGGEHAALVQNWGSDFKDNLAYAKQAFSDIVANRPDLIAKVDASGLGNDPAVLDLLAKHGRLNSGLRGEFAVSRNYEAPSEPARPMPRGQSAAQAELNKIFEDTPPGSPGYAKASVQRRVSQLHEMIAGSGTIVGRGGRTG